MFCKLIDSNLVNFETISTVTQKSDGFLFLGLTFFLVVVK